MVVGDEPTAISYLVAFHLLRVRCDRRVCRVAVLKCKLWGYQLEKQYPLGDQLRMIFTVV
jgi:hypothetical protein